jgi:hypothetical protein
MQEKEYDDDDYEEEEEEEKLQLIQFAVIKKNLSLSWHKYIYRGAPV